jgi:hypothetical protein
MIAKSPGIRLKFLPRLDECIGAALCSVHQPRPIVVAVHCGKGAFARVSRKKKPICYPVSAILNNRKGEFSATKGT